MKGTSSNVPIGSGDPVGSKVVGRQNIKQKCIRYFAAVRNAAGPRFEIIFGGERAYVWGWQGQAGAGRKE